MTGPELSVAARRFIEATNAEDRDALVDAFTATGTVDDFGRTFVGADEIGGWSDAENIGTHNRIRVHQVTGTPEVVHAEISVTGSGYNGTGTLTFHLDGDLIEELVIRG